MTRRFLILFILLAAFAVVGGCGRQTQNSVSSQDAIQVAQNKPSKEEKIKYLAQQAQQFISSKKYDQAVDVAQYILDNLDSRSASALAILEKANDEMQQVAQGAVDDAKKKLNSLGL